ncbi:UPF0046 protein C25E10.12 [Pelomyxa schiedti]|nr:UPF0046 protein C25E10.12 [Pelomyxa schiedti]
MGAGSGHDTSAIVHSETTIVNVTPVVPKTISIGSGSNTLKFVCLADLHGKYNVPVPPGDVLIVCGDFMKWHNTALGLSTFDSYLATLPHTLKIVVSGNHDYSMNMLPRSARQSFLTNATYLEDSGLDLGGCKIYGVPWIINSGAFAMHMNAFSVTEQELDSKFRAVPADTDILLTHIPPLGVRDVDYRGNSLGSASLLNCMARVRPKVVVFGHNHDRPGMSYVTLKSGTGEAIEETTILWARDGDCVYGCPKNTTEGAVFRVHGFISVGWELVEILGIDTVVKELARTWHVAETEARRVLDELPHDTYPNHQALGKTCHCGGVGGKICTCEGSCKLELVQPGTLWNYAQEVGKGEELLALVGKPVWWYEILQLLGKHTLSLHRGWYRVGPQTMSVLTHSGPTINLDTGECTIGAPSPLPTGSRLYLIDAPSNTAALVAEDSGTDGHSPTVMTKEDTLAIAIDVLGDTPVIRQQVKLCADFLNRMTMGGLKTTLQKTIRFGAKEIDISCLKLGSSRVPTNCLVAVTLALLVVMPGCFIPDLQIFSRGCTSAFKRLGIILVEDSWVPNPPLASLFATALLCQTSTAYHPSRALIRGLIRVGVRACASTHAVQYTIPQLASKLPRKRKEGYSETPTAFLAKGLGLGGWGTATPSKQTASSATQTTTQSKTAHANSKPLSSCANQSTPAKAATTKPSCAATKPSPSPSSVPPKAPLTASNPKPEELRLASFLLSLAGSFHSDEQMLHSVATHPIAFYPSVRTMPLVMPIEHIVDQHNFRGIGHLMEGADSFSNKFRFLFSKVTGFNPRKEPYVEATFMQVSNKVRPAQRLCLCLSLDIPPAAILPSIGKCVDVSIPLDPGTLAAAVGPVSGGTGQKRPLLVTLGVIHPEDEVVMLKPSRGSVDLYGKVISEKERSKAISHMRSQSHSLHSPLPIGKLATFDDEQLTWCVDGKPWCDICENGLSISVPVHPTVVLSHNDNDIVYSCTHRGDGMTENAAERLQLFCVKQELRILLRALSLMKQQYTQIKLPVPGLDGGKASDEFSAYSFDADVYKFLLRVSALFPGALRPTQAPNFDIPSPILLRYVETLLAHSVRQKTDTSSTSSACATSNSSVATSSSKKKPTTNTPSHGWSVFHPTRKLMIHQRDAVSDLHKRDLGNPTCAHFLVMDTGYGKTLTTVQYLYELNLRGHLPRSVLWVIPSSALAEIVKELQLCGAPAVTLPTSGIPVEYKFNVVQHDRLRKVVEPLTLNAPFLAAVFDEVDTCYAKTQRTSAAHQIAALSPKVVCQTATPMRNTKHEELATWLAKTVSYPLDKNNWWVAANSIVAKQIDLGIEVEHVEERVKFPSALLPTYKHACENSLWLDAARIVWDELDPTMVSVAKRECEAQGGVLVEARDENHRNRLVALLKQDGIHAGGIDCGTDKSFQAVVVRKDECRGYNWASRLGALVRGVYPGNAASRHQMIGRIKRTGQTRNKVRVVTVMMQGTIVELLHERHTSADTINISLEALAQRYSAEILRMCNEQH